SCLPICRRRRPSGDVRATAGFLRPGRLALRSTTDHVGALVGRISNPSYGPAIALRGFAAAPHFASLAWRFGTRRRAASRPTPRAADPWCCFRKALERGLGSVLGVLFVAQHATAHAEHHRSVASDQGRECRLVAARGEPS